VVLVGSKLSCRWAACTHEDYMLEAQGRKPAIQSILSSWLSIRIYVCDLPDRYASLVTEFADSGITPLADGHAVSRLSDLIIYSVEAAHIDACVREYGPSTKFGAIVAGQTSVKAPEKQAFESHLPKDCAVVSLHSLHGPGVTTEGQPLVNLRGRNFRLMCRS
jgi:prephenate dehydrogenase